jgi:hypothetical protein
MRITVLAQYARGVAQNDDAAGKSLLAELERIKWLLWHGNRLIRRSRVVSEL